MALVEGCHHSILCFFFPPTYLGVVIAEVGCWMTGFASYVSLRRDWPAMALFSLCSTASILVPSLLLVRQFFPWFLLTCNWASCFKLGKQSSLALRDRICGIFCLLSIAGSWLGCSVIPLDWDQWWQVCNIHAIVPLTPLAMAFARDFRDCLWNWYGRSNFSFSTHLLTVAISSVITTQSGIDTK